MKRTSSDAFGLSPPKRIKKFQRVDLGDSDEDEYQPTLKRDQDEEEKFSSSDDDQSGFIVHTSDEEAFKQSHDEINESLEFPSRETSDNDMPTLSELTKTTKAPVERKVPKPTFTAYERPVSTPKSKELDPVISRTSSKKKPPGNRKKKSISVRKRTLKRLPTFSGNIDTLSIKLPPKACLAVDSEATSPKLAPELDSLSKEKSGPIPKRKSIPTPKKKSIPAPKEALKKPLPTFNGVIDTSSEKLPPKERLEVALEANSPEAAPEVITTVNLPPLELKKVMKFPSAPPPLEPKCGENSAALADEVEEPSESESDEDDGVSFQNTPYKGPPISSSHYGITVKNGKYVVNYIINDKRRYVLRTKNYKEALKALRADLKKMRATGVKIHSRIGKLRPVSTSEYVGVRRTPSGKSWFAYRSFGGKRLYGGRFKSEKQAAVQADLIAIASGHAKRYQLNFPSENYPDVIQCDKGHPILFTTTISASMKLTDSHCAECQGLLETKKMEVAYFGFWQCTAKDCKYLICQPCVTKMKSGANRLGKRTRRQTFVRKIEDKLNPRTGLIGNPPPLQIPDAAFGQRSSVVKPKPRLKLTCDKIDDRKFDSCLSPLYLEAAFGHSGCVKRLIERLQDPCQRNKHGFFPVHIAAKRGMLMCVKYLLNETPEEAARCGIIAANNDSPRIIEYLKKKFVSETFFPGECVKFDGVFGILMKIEDKRAFVNLFDGDQIKTSEKKLVKASLEDIKEFINFRANSEIDLAKIQDEVKKAKAELEDIKSELKVWDSTSRDHIQQAEDSLSRVPVDVSSEDADFMRKHSETRVGAAIQRRKNGFEERNGKWKACEAKLQELKIQRQKLKQDIEDSSDEYKEAQKHLIFIQKTKDTLSLH